VRQVAAPTGMAGMQEATPAGGNPPGTGQGRSVLLRAGSLTNGRDPALELIHPPEGARGLVNSHH
jgi:hypothetical protein